MQCERRSDRTLGPRGAAESVRELRNGDDARRIVARERDGFGEDRLDIACIARGRQQRHHVVVAIAREHLVAPAREHQVPACAAAACLSLIRPCYRKQ